MAHEDGKPWMKKRIRVSYAKSEERRGFEIIVSHLPLAFTEEQIRFIFSQVSLSHWYLLLSFHS